MGENLFLGVGRHLLPIPRPIWQQQVARGGRDNRASLGFMSDDHHRVRDLAVVELPRAGVPLPPELFAERLELPLARVKAILDELERHMMFHFDGQRSYREHLQTIPVDRTGSVSPFGCATDFVYARLRCATARLGGADAVTGDPVCRPTETGVCWDVHRLWIIRELARAGAAIILLPMDNDFNGTPRFSPFHAADAVFRAVENRLAFGLGTVNGLSLVIDPYGRITAEGQINQRGVVVGDTFAVPGRTFYSRFGDVFGWLLVGALAGLVIRSWQRARDNQA